ncbi:hypothetical protein AOLI_G00282650 [Acnodon oligacanthus]
MQEVEADGFQRAELRLLFDPLMILSFCPGVSAALLWRDGSILSCRKEDEPQLARYSTGGLLQLGPLGSTTFLPDTKCLVDDGRGRTPSLKKCDAVSRSSQRLWDFTQNGPIISRDTGRCLEVEMSKDANFGLRLVVQRCSGQKWMIRNWIKHPKH